VLVKGRSFIGGGRAKHFAEHEQAPRERELVSRFKCLHGTLPWVFFRVFKESHTKLLVPLFVGRDAKGTRKTDIREIVNLLDRLHDS